MEEIYIKNKNSTIQYLLFSIYIKLDRIQRTIYRE